MSDKRQRIYWDNEKITNSWTQDEKGVGPIARQKTKEFINEIGFYEDIREGYNILDLGVGSNSYLEKDKLDKCNVFASDFAGKMLKSLRDSSNNRPDYKEYIVADVENLPYSDSSMDRIISTFVMRYLDENGQAKAVKETIRIAKPNSKIIIVDYNLVFGFIQFSEFKPEEILENVEIKDYAKELGKTITGKSYLIADLGGKNLRFSSSYKLRGLVIEVV